MSNADKCRNVLSYSQIWDSLSTSRGDGGIDIKGEKIRV